MSIEISQDDRSAPCRRSPEAARFIDEHAALTQPAQPAATLPVWHLGGANAFHRRDIYSDVG